MGGFCLGWICAKKFSPDPHLPGGDLSRLKLLCPSWICPGDACGLIVPEACNKSSVEGKQDGSIFSLGIGPITEWVEDPGSSCSVELPSEAVISGVEAGSAARRLRGVDMRLNPSVLLLETNINEGLT